jgi:hypothetical protein
METIKIYLKKNQWKSKPTLPDFKNDFVLNQDIKFRAGEPITVAGWIDVNRNTLTIHMKYSEHEIKKPKDSI